MQICRFRKPSVACAIRSWKPTPAQELPFDILAARLAEEDGLDPVSLIQVSFILQNAVRPLKLPDVTVRSFAYPGGQRVLPIDRSWLSVMLEGDAIGRDRLVQL